jgi:hypothetical protein
VGEKRGKEEKKSFPFSEFVRLRHKLKLLLHQPTVMGNQ